MRLALFIVVFTACTAHADDWPQWLGPKRDGVWREAGILEKFPAGGPKEVWRKPLGMGYAGPAVAGGRVFITDRTTLTGKTNRTGMERVLCLDEKTGAELWKHEYPCEYRIDYAAGPRCTPTVDGDRVYTLGAMGDLFCLDVAKGTVLWSKNCPKNFGSKVPVWGFAAHPLIDGDKLICLVGGAGGKLVVAFDKKTGRELWAKEAAVGDFGYAPPVIYDYAGKRQLIVRNKDTVFGLDPETGKRFWRAEFVSNASLTVPTPRKVGDDGLLVTSFYNGSMLLRVGSDTAEVVWRGKSMGERPHQTENLNSIIPTAVIDGDHIYGVCSYGELRCLEAKTGKRVWADMRATRGKLTPPKVAAMDGPDESERWSNAFLIRHEDRYFLFNEQGDLIIAKLSPKGYEEVDRTRIIEPTNTARGRKVVWVHPAFAGKCVFVRNDKEVICVSLAK